MRGKALPCLAMCCAFGGNLHIRPCKITVLGCQMALAIFLDPTCLALQASGLGPCYTTLQNLIP